MNDVRPLRVLQITSGDLWAGAEVQLYNLARELNKHPDTDVCVILLNYGMLEQQLTKEGIEVIVIEEDQLSPFELLRQLVRIIHEQRPNIIHTHRAKVNIFGTIASYLAGRSPSLRTAHGSQEHPPSWQQFNKRMIFFFEWFCGRFIQKKIIAVSHDLAEILIRDYPPEKISVIENGIDSGSLLEKLENRDCLADKINSPLKIGIAGRLVPIKRIDLFIKAAHYFNEHYPEHNVSFHIFGDGPLREQLVALNQTSRNSDNVYFEGHCIDMPEKLMQLDALLMTSDHEGLPMVLLEAMILQVPIVAHWTGGIPELLDKGNCGMLVKDHSSEGYAQALFQLVADKTRGRVLTNNALERVMTIYTSDNNARAHIALYKQICVKKMMLAQR